MVKYYLFGAGNNVWGVISYFGSENIIAIIDNEKKRIGLHIKGIPVVSFETYMEQHGNEIVIITAAMHEEIVRQLEGKGIFNYYISPMIQFGLVNTEQMIVEWNLESKREIILFGYNPISSMLVHSLKKCNKKIKIKAITESESEVKNAENDGIEIIDPSQLEENDTVVILSEKSCENIYRKISDTRNVLNIFKLKLNSNKKYGIQLKKYKGLHAGESCFIIGNGPSIKIEDLERIQKNGICNFGMNLAYKVYEKTSWRPTYYTIAEYNILRQYYDEIKELASDHMFIKNFYHMDDTPHMEGVNYYPGCPQKCYLERQKFSDDISQIIYSGYSVMYDTLQIAVYMGFSKIYLIGADFSYLGDPAKGGNHFYDSGFEDKRTVAGPAYLDVTLNALAVAKLYADSKGIEIYNATRGGKLDVFPRVDLDSLIHKKEERCNEV
jgi:NADH/NAD ratio-sensing transcriptional regulator Rex